MIEWLRKRAQSSRAKKVAAAIWEERYTNQVLKMAMDFAGVVDRAGPHERTDRLAQGVCVAGQFPDFSTMFYGPELARAHGQDMNEVIARLEALANEAASSDQQIATFIWAFTLRGYVDARFRYPLSRIWMALQASPEFVEGAAPGYVKEWIDYKY